MKKIMIFIVASLICNFIQAQVTIGTLTPPQTFSILELVSDPAAYVGGLRLPQLTEADKTSLAPQLTGTVLSKGLFIYNKDNDCIEYWNGTEWVAPGEGAGGPWMVAGSTDFATGNGQNIFQSGAVTIGKDSLVSSAVLNVESTDKGVLLPRVTLTGPHDDTTISNPAVGLLVYSTGENPAFAVEGYVFWDGIEWMQFASNPAKPAVATLNCGGAAMNPAQQITGGIEIIAGTVMQIPYTASNGGSYKGVVLQSVGNPLVTATIAPGTLSIGSGVISFALEGMPTVNQQPPSGITFDLTPFLDENPGFTGCDDVTIGHIVTASIESLAVMGNLMWTVDNTGNDVGTVGYTLQIDSPDGKFSFRVRFATQNQSSTIARGDQYLNVQVRNNTGTATSVIWNHGVEYGGDVGGNGVLTIPSQRWGGNNAETGGTWNNATASGTGYGGFWGNLGIYDGSGNGPEYRRYTWIPIGPTNKIAYEVTVMAALDTTTPTTAVSPTLVKVFMKFQQVTAM